MLGADYDPDWTDRRAELYYCYSFLLLMAVAVSEFEPFRFSRWLPGFTLAACPLFIDAGYIKGTLWFLVFGFLISPFLWAFYWILGMVWLLW